MSKTKVPLAPFGLSAAIILVDQATKALVAATVRPGRLGFSAFGDFFWIVRQQNLGMAFSLLDRLEPLARGLVLIALPLLLVAAVVAFYFKSSSRRCFRDGRSAASRAAASATSSTGYSGPRASSTSSA